MCIVGGEHLLKYVRGKQERTEEETGLLLANARREAWHG